jgi:5-methyltetrahydrofolate--homocysteine methyltransferase
MRKIKKKEKTMDIMESIKKGLKEGDAASVRALTKEALTQNVSPVDIMNNGYVAGMDIIGSLFKNNQIFIPEVLVSARAMKAGMEIVRPLLAESNAKPIGKVIMGTVQGDLHDIGKNIVSMLLEGAGFEVIDLGADVAKEKFLEALEKEEANIIGMSALLTTTMTQMKEVIKSIESANLREKARVMIGGAPITQAFAEEISADGYAPDAASAVDVARSLLKRE